MGMLRSTLALLSIPDVAAGVRGGVLVTVFCCICVPRCCSTPTCPQVQVPFTIGGSGSAYIYGLCDKLWRVRAGCNLRAWWLRHALPTTVTLQAIKRAGGAVARCTIITQPCALMYSACRCPTPFCRSPT